MDYLFLELSVPPYTKEQCKVKITAIKVNFGSALFLMSINCLGTVFGISAFKFFSSITFHSSFIHGYIICTYLFLIGLSNSLEAFIS